MSETKKKTDYKLLYHELLEKYDDDFVRLEQEKLNAYDENDLLKAANEEAKKEITSLRHTIGGYITQAARTKKELANLKADYELAKKSVSDLTKVSLENKAMVKECVNREKEMEESYNEHIKELDHQIIKLTGDLADQKKRRDEMERMKTFYKENYEYYKNMPWYKRIFVK